MDNDAVAYPLLLLTYVNSNESDDPILQYITFESSEGFLAHVKTIPKARQRLQLMLPNSPEQLGYEMHDIVFIRLCSVDPCNDGCDENNESQHDNLTVEFVAKSGACFRFKDDRVTNTTAQVIYCAENHA